MGHLFKTFCSSLRAAAELIYVFPEGGRSQLNRLGHCWEYVNRVDDVVDCQLVLDRKNCLVDDVSAFSARMWTPNILPVDASTTILTNPLVSLMMIAFGAFDIGMVLQAHS